MWDIKTPQQIQGVTKIKSPIRKKNCGRNRCRKMVGKMLARSYWKILGVMLDKDAKKLKRRCRKLLD